MGLGDFSKYAWRQVYEKIREAYLGVYPSTNQHGTGVLVGQLAQISDAVLTARLRVATIQGFVGVGI